MLKQRFTENLAVAQANLYRDCMCAHFYMAVDILCCKPGS